MNGSVGSRVRRWTVAAVGAALVVLVPGPAIAGSGPGTNFPEQPGASVAQACDSILSTTPTAP